MSVRTGGRPCSRRADAQVGQGHHGDAQVARRALARPAGPQVAGKALTERRHREVVEKKKKTKKKKKEEEEEEEGGSPVLFAISFSLFLVRVRASSPSRPFLRFRLRSAIANTHAARSLFFWQAAGLVPKGVVGAELLSPVPLSVGVARLLVAGTEAGWARAFGRWDRNGDGCLTVREVERALASAEGAQGQTQGPQRPRSEVRRARVTMGRL